MCLRLFWIKKKKNPHLHLEQLKNASLKQSSLFSSFSLSSLSHRPLKLLTVESLSTCMLHRVSCVVQEFCSDKRDKEKEALTDSECTRGKHRMFLDAFDGGSHGSAHTVGCELPPLTTIESTELLSRQMTALIWGKRRISKPVPESQRGSLYCHMKGIRRALRYPMY